MWSSPLIDPSIYQLAPDLKVVSIIIDASEAGRGKLSENFLKESCDYVLAGGPSWGKAHLDHWADIYRGFNAKPNRTPCSAQALRKRVEKDGFLQPINPLVDLYNAVSLRYCVPIGGENYAAYVGRPRLMHASGEEPFDTFSNGEPVVEYPDKGEVIWRDDTGVTCRRWNWRQGVRTRLDDVTGRMWFVLEALGTMPDDALREASSMLINGLKELAPGCVVTDSWISKNA
ncbi:B3/4 domain-containing protein [Brucellaceae bacterium C25G]